MINAKARILLVDDDPSLLRLLALRLEGEGFAVQAVESARDALAALARHRPDLIVTDLRMDDMDGMTLLEALKARAPWLPVIMMTAHGTIPDAVAATQKGAFSFITKPIEKDRLLAEIERALKLGGNSDAKYQTNEDMTWRASIITRSAAMEEILSQARLVAESDASVLIQGESGTGKEMLAQAIHKASTRSSNAFVTINCGAIPEALLESELFGHEKGAFTGAVRKHMGLFQAADGGTIFLDEIGDMPLPLQVKLLRVLQERKVRPVGSTQDVPVNVRVISATHRDLDEAIEGDEFRSDLYYRLNVVTLRIPSLSERREDIPVLAQHFLKIIAERNRKNIASFSPEALELLVTAAWPGNVRQLYNVVEQTVILATAPVVPLTLVQRAIKDKGTDVLSYADARHEFERDYLVRMLKIANGSVAQAARLAQRNRTEFYKLLSRHDLDPTLYKSDV